LHITTLSEEDRATATGDMRQKLVKFSHVVFEICEQTDRQTDRQTKKQEYSVQYFAFIFEAKQ